MIKRLKWFLIGYIVGMFTIDIVKRYMDEKYSDNRAYITFTSALASVSDFQKNREDLDEYIDSN